MLALGIPNKKQVVRNNFEHFYLPPFPLQNPQTPFISQKINFFKSRHVWCQKNGLGARDSTQKTINQSEHRLLRYRPINDPKLWFGWKAKIQSINWWYLSNGYSDWFIVFCVESLASSPFFWHQTCLLLEKLIFWLIKGVLGFSEPKKCRLETPNYFFKPSSKFYT